MKPNNPFLISGYYSPEYFCDRESETAVIMDALNNERNVTLISPRRMGKTGLIKHVFHNLRNREPEIVTLYMDIFSTQNLGDFVRLFANTVLGKLDSVPQKAVNRISRFIKSCRPVVTFDDMTGSPKVMIDVAKSSEEATLREVFEYLQSSERQCYIAIDEFQQITEYPEKGIEALLRSYIQFLPNVKFIFAGSKRHIMEEMFISAKRPFYQSTQMLFLKSIDRDMYFDFANVHLEKKGLSLHRDVFEYIYDRFEGHTWYIQSVLNSLYGYPYPANEAIVEHAIFTIVSENAYAYENLLAAHTPGSCRLLKAIAQEGCVKEILSGDFITRHNLKAASTVSSAVKRLIDNELVYKSPQGYTIYDRFMAEWLRNQGF